MSAATGRIRKRAGEAALVLLGVLLALTLAEGLLRLGRLSPDASRMSFWTPKVPCELARRPDGTGVLRLIPNARATQLLFTCRGEDCRADKKVSWSINSAGMRDREHSLAKPAGVVRVVALGDSFTEGFGVEAAEAFPQQLERLLNARLRGKPRVEVLNTAVQGFGTYDEWRDLLERGAAYHPDVVVVGLYLNDSEPWSSWAPPAGVLPPELEAFKRRYQKLNEDPFISNVAPTDAPRSRFYLLRWAQRLLAARRSVFDTIRLYRFIWTEENWYGMRRFREALDGLADFQRARRVPVVVVIFPKLFRLDGDYPFEDIHEKIRSWCAARALATLDLLPYLRGRDPATLWEHPSDRHPNPWVHRLTATLLMKRLLALRPLKR